MRVFGIILVLCLMSCDITYGRKRNRKNHVSSLRENEVETDENMRPVVGILSLEPPSSIQKTFAWCASYIASSYVKFVEMAGARVLPIFIDKPATYYENVFNSINGLLIPGGAISLENLNGSGYSRVGETLYKMAVASNNKGDYFPILGICLGSELLSILVEPNNTNHLSDCSCSDQALPLNMSKDFKQSRLFHDLPSDVYASLTTQPVTANYHRMCLTPESVSKSALNTLITVLSTNQDVNGLSFVSTYEVIKYPFYALQWHPEKNPFEWSTTEKLPHTQEAVRVAQHMANFFVSEARKSTHKFAAEKVEQKALIYNYHPVPTINIKTNFTELYVFHKNETSPL